MRSLRISAWMLAAAVAASPLAWPQTSGPMQSLGKARTAAAAGSQTEKPSPTPAEKKKLTPEKRASSSTAATTPAAQSGKRGERRDPFKSPLQKDAPGLALTFTCGPGIRSIMVGQADVNGVVKAPTGYLAVVTTTGDRTFFLRPGNEVCNGKVDRITPDSVVFQEKVLDSDGKPTTREVIKKLPAEAK